MKVVVASLGIEPNKIWTIIVALILLYLLLVLRAYLIGRKMKVKVHHDAFDISSLPFRSYAKDVFEDILYKWSYIKPSDTDVLIVSIDAFCPKDNCCLVRNLHYYFCPICKKDFLPKQDNEVRALIMYNIKNNVYNN